MRPIIADSLWIGNAIDARDMTVVLRQGITAVLDIALEEKPIQFPREIIYCRFPIVDGQGNAPELLKVALTTLVRFIEAKIQTLVSCGAGMSRSPALVAAAISLLNHQPADEILLKVVGNGPRDVSPPLWADLKQVAASLRAPRPLVAALPDFA